MRSGTSAQVGSKRISKRKADKNVRAPKFSVLAAAVAGVLAFKSAQAVDYTWDNTGTPGVAPAGGTGIWNTTGLNWTADVGATYIAWPNTDPNSDTAIFGGTAGTVSLGNAILAGGIIFNTTGYVIDNGGVAANTLTTASVNVANGSSATISAIIAGGGNLVKSGAGTLVLSGANTYTGNTTVFDGTLALGAGGNINAAGDLSVFFGSFDLGANSATANTVNINSGASITGTGTLTANSFQLSDGTVSASLAGTSGITKTSAGTVVLSGVNSYTGGTQITGGFLSIGSDANLGASPASPTSGNITIGGGVLRANTTLTIDSNRGITVGTGGGTIDVVSGAIATYGGVIDGTTGFTKTGAGNLVLTGANTFTGGVTVKSGTGSLVLGTGASLDSSNSLSVQNGATFDVGSNNQTLGAVTLVTGNLVGSGSITGSSYDLQSGNVSTVLAGSAGVTKNQSGTVTLTAANTYSGPTTVNLGTLALGAGGSIINSSSLTVAGGTFALGANSVSTNAVSLVAGNITGTGGVLTGTSYAVQSGSISAILAGGSASLTKTGTGTVTLTAANTYGGTTNVNAGTLAIGTGGSIPAGSALNVGGGTFDIGANSTSSGPVTLTSGNINGTTGVLSAPSYLVQSGTISANLGNGSAALTKNTTGTVTLKGNNSYGGGTTISAGKLAMTSNGAMGSGVITLDGGTLQLGDTPTAQGLMGQFYNQGPTNVSNINPDYATLAAFNTKYNPITPAISVPSTTGGVTQLDWPDTAGQPFANQGFNSTPTAGDNIGARWTGKIFVANAGPTQFFTRSDDGSMIFIDGQQVVDNNFFQGETERTGLIDLSAGFHDFTLLFYEGGGNAGLTASWTPVGGSKAVIPNSVLFQTPAGNPVTFGSANAVNVTASSTLDLSLTAPASTHNLGALTRSGTNTLTVSGQGRTLNFTGTSLNGSPGDNITFDTTADINPGLVSDGGNTGLTLTKLGTGSFTLSNSGNDLNGTSIDLKAGRLRVSASGAGVDPLGGASVILDGGTLSLSNPAGGTNFNPALTIADNSTFERAGATNDTLSSALAIPPAKNLNVSVLGGSLNHTSTISGDGSLTKLGAGTLILSGGSANTYSGGTTVNAGALQLNKTPGVDAIGNLTVNYGRVGWSADEQIANNATVNLNGGGILSLGGAAETIGILNTTGGTISGGTLNVPTINKTLGNTTIINSRLAIPGGNINVTSGTLRLTNTAVGAGANDLSGVTLNVSNGGNLRVDRTVGGSNPIGSNAIALNNSTFTVGGQTSFEQGGLSGQIFRPLPVNIAADNQVANTGDANLSLRGLLAFDSLPNMNAAFNTLMAVPYGSGTLSSQVAYNGINVLGTVGAGGIGSFMGNSPTPINVLNSQIVNNVPQSGPYNFGAKWTGKINIPNAGVTNFFTASDDGSVIFIDGVPVVYNNFFQGNIERSGSINLTAGLHDIVIGYYQGGGGGEVTASYQPAGGAKQVIPSAVLFAPTITDSAPITTSGTSTINVADAAQALTGPLTVNGQLNIVGGAIVPSSTTFDGNVNIFTTGGGLITTDVSESNGPVTLTKSGPGSLIMKGSSGLSGGINVNGGVLIIDGTSNHSAMNVNSTGTLRLMNQASVGNVDINVNSGGTLDVTLANADLSRVKVGFGGKLSLGAPQSTATGAFTPGSPIFGTFEVRGFDIGTAYPLNMPDKSTVNIFTNGGNRIYASQLVLDGQVNITTSGNVTTFTGVIGGNGGLTLNSNTEVRLESTSIFYPGPTIVETGILKSRESGNLQSTSSVTTINGEIWADDGGNNFTVDRFSDGGIINMRGGALRHFGKGGQTSSETFGTVNALGGVTIDSQATAANTIGIMTINSLVRPVGGRINFPNTNNLGSSTATQTGRIFINTFQNGNGAPAAFSAASLNDGIIGGGVTVGTDFATYTDAFGVTAQTTFKTTADAAGAAGWQPADNVKRTITAAETLVGSKTINSLTIVNAAAQNFELGVNTLTLDTGGLSQSGGNTLTFIQTGGSATTGVITANGGELFALAANTIQFNAPIVNNPATPTTPLALTIGGGGTIRLANLNNSFSGGINISSSTLNTASSNNVGKTIGSNVINFTGNGTLALKDNGSGNGVTLNYGNNVNVYGNATIDVNNSSANNSSTFVMGNLLMDAGRTLNVTGANSYRLQLGNTTLNGDAIFNPTTADVTIGALNDQSSPKTLTKTGFGALTLSANATSWTGPVIINQGALVVAAPTALGSTAPSVVVNANGVFGAGVANQDLSNVIINPGGGLRLSAPMDRSVANTLPTSPLSILEIGTTSFPNTYNDVPLSSAGATIRQATTAAATYASDLTLPAPVTFDIPSQATTFTGQIKGEAGSIIKIGGNNLILNPAAPNTYAGGTTILGGTLSANAAGALGTGPINTIAGTLAYNAANAGSGQVISANGSSIQLMVGQINLGSGVSSLGNDRFDIAAGNVISADQQRLRLLSRYGSSTMASNINLAPGAIVAHQDVGAVGEIQDLGTTPDLFFGIGTVGNTANWAASNINIGANTPWMGVSTDRSSRTIISGDIVVDDGSNGGTQPRTLGAITLQSINNATLTLGNGTALPTMGIRKSNAGNSKVDVNLVGRVTLASTQANFDGVNKFVLQSGTFLSFAQPTAMGTGAGITNMEALAGSVIDIGGGTPTTGGAVNGNITMRAGSVFRVDDANQFTGTGSIFVDPGTIVALRNSGVFGNLPAQVTGNATAGSGFTNAKGAIFRLEVDNITNLDASASDQGIFSIVVGNRASGALTINSDSTLGYLNGGVTIYDNNSRTFTPSALNIGPGGAFFSADGSGSGLFTLTVAGSITPNAASVLTIGSPKIDFQDKNGHVQIDAPFTAALAGITKITSGDFILNNASTAVAGKLVTGDIIGNGGGGNLKFGNNNTTLSSRLLAGTVANNILVNDLVKSDINIDGTPFTTTTRGTVLQKFTINGNTNTDGRKLFVSRRAGTVLAGIDLANVTINGGGVLTVDEDNTDVRVNLTMAGDGTITQFFNPTGGAVTDQFDLLNVSSDVAGTHRTLTQGRVTDISTAISSSTITMNSTIFGNVSGDMTINQVRGRLTFDAASQILAPTGTQSGAIINSLGVDGNGPAGEGYIEVHAGQSGTGALASGTVNLGGNTQLQLFVDESGGAQIVNNPNLAVNIIPNSSGYIGSNRNLTAGTSGRALLNSVNVGANSTLFMSSANNAETAIGTVNMAGDGTITNVSSDNKIFVGNVAAGSHKLTFDGTRHTQVTGNVTSGPLASNGFVDFNPGAANTSTVNASSVSVRGAITASSGITDMGTATITGTPGATVSGLREGVLPGAFNTSDPNPGNYVRPGPMQAKVRVTNSDPGMINGWASNTTYAYSGQIFLPDRGDGTSTLAIGECFDDSVQVVLDGAEVLRDGQWNASTSSGSILDQNSQPLAAGWHDIEFRFGQGVGGVGASSAAGWNSLLSFGLQLGTSGPFDNKTDGVTAANVNGATQSRYTFPVDNGTMNLFRVALPASGDVNVGAGAELRAGGLSGIVNANLNGATGSAATLTLVDTGGPSASTVTNLAVNGDGAISQVASSSIAAENLNVAAGANLALSGGGTVRVSTTHTLGDGSNINVNGGKLVINSTANAGNGGITVNNSGRLGGNGNILGTVTVNSGGHVAPGNSVGAISVGGLTLNGGGLLDMEGDGSGFDRINVTVDNGFNIAGSSTINLSDLGGVTAGDYVLIDYSTAYSGTLSDLSLSSSTLGSFSASLFDDTADTSIKLHLAASNDQPQWNVDANGSWGVAANWDPQTVPDAANATANLLGKITAPRTITLDGNRTVGTLNFDNTNTYTIASGSSGTLTVLGSITVTSGSHVISAPLAVGDNVAIGGAGTLTASGGLSIAAGKTFTKSGAGTLTVSGAQGHGVGSTLKASGGVVNLNSNAGGGSAATSNLALNIGGGPARVNLGSNQDLSSLTITTGDANSQTLDLKSPSTAGAFNQVQVFASNLAAAKASLYTAIVNANAAGAPDPLDGITDSGLHASSKIGLAQQADHITIRSTRIGDLNLDGSVTISDFIDLASNFGTVGTATWQEGDLNYDRNVSISDFIDLASNFGTSYAGSAGAVSAADIQTVASFASSIGVDPSVVGSAVPEPGTLSLLAIGAMGLMGRRRRSRNA